MSELWPVWRTDSAPQTGEWFTARVGLSGYVTRCRFDPERWVQGMAFSDSFKGAFVDAADQLVTVGQWWPEGEGQPAIPAIPAMAAPTLNEIAPGMFEMNGARIDRSAYVALFEAIKQR